MSTTPTITHANTPGSPHTAHHATAPVTAHERRVVVALTGLAEIFAETMTPGRLAGYLLALSDLGTDEVLAAIGRAARACKFFPRPAELRDFVDQARESTSIETSRALAHAREQHRLEAWQGDLAERERTQAERLQRERETWAQAQPAVQECRAALRALIERASMPAATPEGTPTRERRDRLIKRGAR